MERPFCDVYMTHHKRPLQSHEITPNYGGINIVEQNLNDQDRIVYPFVSIMNDVTRGADLGVRFADFLRM
jgi:hypothetical protein